MSDSVNALSSATGLSTDLVHSGLGTILSFVRQHVGEETYQKIEQSIPGASDFLNRFESAPEGKAPGTGGLFGAVTDLAARFLGGKSGELAKLVESFNKLGFTPQQVESFLPKALDFLRAHLPAELVEQIVAKLPAMAELAGAKTG